MTVTRIGHLSRTEFYAGMPWQKCSPGQLAAWICSPDKAILKKFGFPVVNAPVASGYRR
jgi:hypothetical protein